MSIENFILSELKRKNIPVKEAFEALGVSKQTFYNRIKAANPDPDFLTKVKEIFDIDTNIETVYASNSSEIVALRKNIRTKKALIPFYNADFMAGNAEAFYDDKTIHPEYYMDIPEFYGCTAFRAYSDSMEKKIKSGSILFGVKLDEWNVHLEFGQIYGITCKDRRRYLKYIKKDKVSKENFLLVSENHHYESFELPKNRIKNIWLIEGWIEKGT